MQVHIDTDLGDTPDDACALAMMVGMAGVELVGVTTTADADGRRAEQVVELLRMLGVRDVPVVSGSDRDGIHDLLRTGAETGAAIVALGPYTNLAHLEAGRPGALSDVPVVAMGGWVDPFPPGYPAWGPARDSNVQTDTEAAEALFASEAELTFVPCAAAGQAFLRTADLARLTSSGPVGASLARQSVRHGEQQGYPALAREHPVLEGLVSFHWDPVTCAVAAGWAGASVREERLSPRTEGNVLHFERDPGGRRTRVVSTVDGAAFADLWLGAVERAQLRTS